MNQGSHTVLRSQRFQRLLKVLNKRRTSAKERGVALVIVLSSLVILAVMLTEFQDETSADFGHALAERDALKAEYAARSAVNLSRLLIASEPTIRKAVAPMFLMMKQGPPQIPVWEFANDILGAFNDKAGMARFKGLAPVDFSEGEALGLEGAGFDVQVIDEDSMLNFNQAARPSTFAKQRMVGQLLGLMAGPQYDPLFSERDAEGNFTTRAQICAAIIDWTDSDQDAEACDLTGQNVSSGAEDSFYQLLDVPYKRKNAAFDSLEELHLVRGVSDDFWATFIQPDPLDPKSRMVTVWGREKVNINTASPQTLLSLVCSHAVKDEQSLCTDTEQQMSFLMVANMLKATMAGVPLFPSPNALLQTLQGKGMLGPVMASMNIQAPKINSVNELKKEIATTSKVFSIYATGTATSGKRKTIRRIHAVVDFEGAPRPPDLSKALDPSQNSGDITQQSVQDAMNKALGASLPDGASPDALVAAFRPSPGGRIIYYRID